MFGHDQLLNVATSLSHAKTLSPVFISRKTVFDGTGCQLLLSIRGSAGSLFAQRFKVTLSYKCQFKTDGFSPIALCDYV